MEAVAGWMLGGAFEGWTRGEQVGHGADGEVFEYLALDDVCRHVVKVFTSPERCFAEAMVLQHAARAHKAHVVKLVVVVPMGDKWGLVMPRAVGGSLVDYLAFQPRPLRPKVARTLAYSLLRALALLHEDGIAHGDMKADNVLVMRAVGVDAEMCEVDVVDAHAAPTPAEYYGDLEAAGASVMLPQLVLADFGRATVSGVPGIVRGVPSVGTWQYMAPEVSASDRRTVIDLCAADVWSAGILLSVLVFGGYLPFDSDVLHGSHAHAEHVRTAVAAIRALLAAWTHPFVQSGPWHLVEEAAADGSLGLTTTAARAMRAAWERRSADIVRTAAAAGVTMTVRKAADDALPGAVDLVLRHMLVADPAARATAEECFEHPWVAAGGNGGGDAAGGAGGGGGGGGGGVGGAPATTGTTAAISVVPVASTSASVAASAIVGGTLTVNLASAMAVDAGAQLAGHKRRRGGGAAADTPLPSTPPTRAVRRRHGGDGVAAPAAAAAARPATTPRC